MSVIAVDELEALVSSGLETDALEGVRDRAEAWLADDPTVGIGILDAEQTIRIWITPPGHAEPLLLPRPTTEAELEVDDDAGDPVSDVVLTGPARIERTSGAWPGRFLDVTFTPNDLAAVVRTVVELVRLDLTAAPYNQEATEGHSYSRPVSVTAQREQLARALRPHRGPGTIRLSSGVTHRITT